MIHTAIRLLAAVPSAVAGTWERLGLVAGGDLTLASVSDLLGRLHGDRPLVFDPDTGVTLTGVEIADRVAAWSNSIATRIQPGDRVVVAVPNGYDQLLLCLAVARAGGLPAPVNDQMTRSEITHVRRDAGASLTLRDPAELDLSAPLREPASPAPDDIAALFYTSGTTGSPKGAVLTHRGLVGQMGAATMWPSWLRRDEVLAALPVAHIMGFVVYLGLGVAGLTAVAPPHFRASQVLDLIETRRVTAFVGVPSMYRKLREAGAADRDLRSVRLWISGADVMPPGLAAEFKAMGATAELPLIGAVGEAAFVEGYGMVESAGGVALRVSPPGINVGSGGALGFPLPGNHLRVVGEDGRPVGIGQVGELWIRGPGVLEGYWNAPDATSAALTDDGWLRTGDMVRQGPLRSITFQGRGKHVIKSGGFSVYPAEVEETLDAHPDVLEAVVLGVDDAELGQIPVAVVRIRAGSTITPPKLKSWADRRLARYKSPRRIVFVDELPQTGTGKVQREHLLRVVGAH